MRNHIEILDMLKEVCGFNTDVDLANALNTSSNTIKQWRKNKRIALHVIVDFAIDKGIDLNRLFNDKRDFLRNMGMTREDEAYLCASNSNEILRFNESKDIAALMPPYDVENRILLNIPDYSIHTFDRYWIVPDERLSPTYSQGDILIIRKKSGIIKDGTVAVWGCKLQIDHDKRTEYPKAMILGVAYKCGNDWNGLEEYKGRIRIAATNPNFPEIIPLKILDEFEIVVHIKVSKTE